VQALESESQKQTSLENSVEAEAREKKIVLKFIS
jgi:hypothetical protein